MIKRILGIAFGLTGILSGCSPDTCYHGNYLNITSYEVSIDEYTPKGIGIDQPDNPEHMLNPEEIDILVDNLESCLNENFRQDQVIEDGQYKDAMCIQKEFNEPIEIKRECISVKVPDDLYASKCTDQYLFPCDINEQACRDKGIEPTEECPCDCRAMVQDNNTVITNHVLNVFQGELARIVTNCNNPWIVDQIKTCL